MVPPQKAGSWVSCVAGKFRERKPAKYSHQSETLLAQARVMKSAQYTKSARTY
jgi:hypothetical protein